MLFAMSVTRVGMNFAHRQGYLGLDMAWKSGASLADEELKVASADYFVRYTFSSRDHSAAVSPQFVAANEVYTRSTLSSSRKCGV